MEYQRIGVCVVVLNRSKNEILLGKRKNSYKAGMYGIPGGRLELKESLEACGKRELKEETGIEAVSLTYIGVIRELQTDYNFIHFAFLCKEYLGEPSLSEPEKCEGWGWFPLEKLPDNIIPGHKAAIDIFLNKNTNSVRDLL